MLLLQWLCLWLLDSFSNRQEFNPFPDFKIHRVLQGVFFVQQFNRKEICYALRSQSCFLLSVPANVASWSQISVWRLCLPALQSFVKVAIVSSKSWIWSTSKAVALQKRRCTVFSPHGTRGRKGSEITGSFSHCTAINKYIAANRSGARIHCLFLEGEMKFFLRGVWSPNPPLSVGVVRACLNAVNLSFLPSSLGGAQQKCLCRYLFVFCAFLKSCHG